MSLDIRDFMKVGDTVEINPLGTLSHVYGKIVSFDTNNPQKIEVKLTSPYLLFRKIQADIGDVKIFHGWDVVSVNGKMIR